MLWSWCGFIAPLPVPSLKPASGAGFSDIDPSGIPIGEIDGSDQDSPNRRFNVASLMIFRISRQTCASQHGNVVSRENGHTVPRALPLPDCFVPESPKGVHGKCFLLCRDSWRLTTSGSALDSQARRLSSRLLMLLMLKGRLSPSPFPCSSWICCDESLDVTRRVVAQKPCKTLAVGQFRVTRQTRHKATLATPISENMNEGLYGRISRRAAR
jgi:hypothetical protein